jgi:hypothetical protein
MASERNSTVIFKGNDPRPATQDWVHQLSIMQQSVLLGIVRGPDGVEKYHPVKPLLRWYRRCILISALDGRVLATPYEPGGGSFTGPSLNHQCILYDGDWRPDMNKLVDAFMRTMDQMPIHFWLHMAHAFEIVGYKHPDEAIRGWFRDVYFRMVNAMHVHPETEAELDRRLGDTREGWIERSDAAIDKNPAAA